MPGLDENNFGNCCHFEQPFLHYCYLSFVCSKLSEQLWTTIRINLLWKWMVRVSSLLVQMTWLHSIFPKRNLGAWFTDSFAFCVYVSTVSEHHVSVELTFVFFSLFFSATRPHHPSFITMHTEKNIKNRQKALNGSLMGMNERKVMNKNYQNSSRKNLIKRNIWHLLRQK